MTNSTQENSGKYLVVKSNILITKLKSTYPDILIGISNDVPDQIIIKFNKWVNTHIYILNGSRNEESVYIVYSTNKNLDYYGILSDNLNTQIEQILTIINFVNNKF